MAKSTTPVATTPKANSQAIVAKIISEFKDRNRAEIRKWRQALELAKRPDTPRMYMIQDLIENLGADGHLISQLLLRKAATICNTIAIIDKKTGEEIPEKTELFRSEWFFNLVSIALDKTKYGYTLIELTDPTTMTFQVIPRRNVCAPLRMVYFEVGGDKGIDYTTGFERTLLEVGKDDDMGIAELLGALIWKRNAIQSWAEYTEKFGMPMITATTNKTNKGDIDKLESMLRTLGEAAQAVLPEGTTIDIKSFEGKDAYMVYDKLIERMNTELGKPITGGTMLSDNGSSRSQAEVHERNLDDKIAWFDKRSIEFLVNGKLLAMMQSWGWNVNPETDKFIYEESSDVKLTELYTIVDKLLTQGYDVKQEWISKKFGIPLMGTRKVPTSKQPQIVAFSNGNEFQGAFSENFK